jgi:hypothetical protein
MPAELIPVAHTPPAKALETAEDSTRLRLALLGELEASLDASRKALLALDLAGIELGTREQVGLLRKLEAVLGRGTVQPGLEDETRRSGQRILQAARLQWALLARARAKLRVLANMLAGQNVSYGPLVARNSAPLQAFGQKSRREI